jgi:hypothetical protein
MNFRMTFFVSKIGSNETGSRQISFLEDAGFIVLLPRGADLLSNTQLGQIRADGVERGDDLICRGEQIEFSRVAGTAPQQSGSWIATGINLDRVDDDSGSLDVRAGAIAG